MLPVSIGSSNVCIGAVRKAITWNNILYSQSGRASYHKISMPQDSGLGFSNRSEIWQAPQQQCCRDACQI